MKTKFVVLSSVAGVCGVLLVVAGVLLARGLTTLSDTQKKLKSARRTLEDLYKKEKPFPSAENVAQETRNVEQLRSQFEDLVLRLSRGQVNDADFQKTLTGFALLLGKKREELQKKADAGSFVAGSSFGFGFERYFTPAAPQPMPDDVPKLTQQLVMIEKLCDALFVEDVTVSTIKREEFETLSPGSRRRQKMMEETSLYEKHRFEFTLSARESALKTVLERLARQEMFVAVTRLVVERTGLDIKDIPRSAGTPDSASSAGAAPIAEGAEPAVDPKKTIVPMPQERIVCGPQLETPMKIAMDVDVYVFKGVKTGDAN